MSNINQKTVAVLYIATGRYTVFWKYFYESAESSCSSVPANVV